MTGPRIAFVHNFCSHYTVRTFEILSRMASVNFYFFSGGDDWYWLKDHGVRHGRFSHTYLRGLRFGRTRVTPGLPYHLIRGRYDLIIKCINGRFALPVTYLTARALRKPFILYTGLWHRLGTRAHRWGFPLLRAIYRHADAVVVYGEHVKRYLVSEGVDSEKIFIAPHAVDNDLYGKLVTQQEQDTLRERLGIGRHRRFALFVGRLETVKGLPYLMEAFRSTRHPDTLLVIAGDGAERGHLQDLAHKMNLASRVVFVGYIPPEETVTLYASASVLVLPSIATTDSKELWGLVVNEAFNQGLPVITTDCVGAAAGGLVEDGRTGFVVPERNSGALADAMDKILGNSALHATMARNARERITTWTQENMALGFGVAINYVAHRRNLPIIAGVRES